MADSPLTPEERMDIANGLADPEVYEDAKVIPLDPPPIDDSESTSWESVDLSKVTIEKIEANRAKRSDGAGLLYPGRLHWLMSAPEQGKTWVLFSWAKQVLDDGGKVLILDFEDVAANFKERMNALGVSDDVLNDQDRVRFNQIADPLGLASSQPYTHAIAKFEELLEWKPDFVAMDGVTNAMDIEGLDPMSNMDTAAWIRLQVKPFTRAGASVVAVDHKPKNGEAASRYAIGAQHKLAALDGVAYNVEAIQQPARHTGKNMEPIYGRIRLTITKDRAGAVRGAVGPGNVAADLDIRIDPDGGVFAAFNPPDMRGAVNMRNRVLEYLLVYPGCSQSKIASDIQGNRELIIDETKRMVQEGLINMEIEGQSHRHYLTDAGEALANGS